MIRYESEEELARRKRVAIEALKSTGAKRVFYQVPAAEVPAEDGPSKMRELRRLPKAEAVSSPAPAKGFDRKAYQRAYMRTYLPKWRARRKAVTP